MDSALALPPGSVLHVGCGGSLLHPIFDGCSEVRLDIDPDHEPDIIASMTDMGDIGGFDYLFSCHSLEHLSPADGAKALGEFRRVLRDGGLAIIVVPDVEGVSPTQEVLYESPAGPITGHDLFYGHKPEVNEWMAHKTAFIAETLQEALDTAGFSPVKINRATCHNLIACAHK
jgi:SAM-dependent methyltransferase